MQAIRQGGWLRRRGSWQVVGVTTAVIAAGGLAYPAVSTMFNAQSRDSAVTTHTSAPATSVIELGNAIPASSPGTAQTSAPPPSTTPATAPPKSAAPTGTAGKSPTAAGAAPKRTADSGTGQKKAGAVSASAPLAGRIKPGQTHTGVATFYDSDGSGACGFDRSSDHMTAAMNQADYEGSNACGAYVQVRGSSGVTITVRITNLCPYPCRVGQLDLDPEAYKLLAPLKTGETPITWKLVSPNISGGIAIRYKTGSSQWWCGIQVINHRNPVARLEVKASGTWKALPRTDYNYFLSEKGAGCGGDIRVTDIYGQRLVVGALPIKADLTQRTSLQFAGH